MNKWRIIFTGANDAFFNMALDEALLLTCQKEASPPVLRLYLWERPAVSIGYFQTIGKTVDRQKCKERDILVVRRITGGRAVLHEDEITYSVCASRDHFPELGESTIQTCQKLSMALLESLHVLGIDGEWVRPSRGKKPASVYMNFFKPCFASNSRYEILVGGKKLIGSAQRRFSFRSDQNKKGCFIQHGSILTGKGKRNLVELLSEDSSVEMMRRNLEERSTNIEKILKRRVAWEEIVSALKTGFEKVFSYRMEDSMISEEELKIAQNLKEKKYLSEGWNLAR